MNEQKKPKRAETDEIGDALESGNEVNQAIEQQGDEATAGIPRDTDAAKHQQDEAGDDNRELRGHPDPD